MIALSVASIHTCYSFHWSCCRKTPFRERFCEKQRFGELAWYATPIHVQTIFSESIVNCDWKPTGLRFSTVIVGTSRQFVPVLDEFADASSQREIFRSRHPFYARFLAVTITGSSYTPLFQNQLPLFHFLMNDGDRNNKHFTFVQTQTKQ